LSDAAWLHNGLIRLGMAAAYRRDWVPLLQMCRQPDAAQWHALQRILHANRDSGFGQEHGFASIDNVAEFRRRVPSQTYETLRPYIDAQMTSGSPALTSEPPVMYARTSGTTGQPKLLPVTASMLDRFRRHQRMLAAMQVRVAPRAYAGKALNVVGAAIEGHTASGAPYGSMSGFVRSTTPWTLRRREAVPDEVHSIDDYDTRYLLILRLALAERHVSCMGSANPGTFLRLQTVLDVHAESLIRSVANGDLPPTAPLPDAVQAALAAHVRKDPCRARELDALAARGTLQIAQIWPQLQLVTTWTGGQCRMAMAQLHAMLPAATQVLELGYIASELRATLPIAAETTHALPLIADHFLEFVERDAWEAGQTEFLGIEQLADEREYYVFVTTDALYRYAMDDIVRVRGFIERTPLIEFVQKGRGCTSMVGEKLYESQVVAAMQEVVAQFGGQCAFYQLVADEQALRYLLYVEWRPSLPIACEVIAETLERRLSQYNVEYAAKRDSGRLHALEARSLCQGTGERYMRHHVQAGQRENQFKQAVLQYARDVRFPLEEYVER